MDTSTVNSPAAKAIALLRQVKGDSGEAIKAPIDLDEIIQHLGITVIEDISLQEKGVIGQILFSGSNAVVRLNPIENSYRPRRRFTLAHEIGHFLLHRESKEGFVDSRKTMSRSESYWDRYESEANSFAAALLMPSALIHEEAGEIARRLIESDQKITEEDFTSHMAKIFDVSNKSMEYRLRRLKFLS